MTLARRMITLATIVGAVLLAGCDRPRATPAPDFAGRADEASRTEVLEYATSLEFDSLPEATDTITISKGVEARIDPEIGSRALDTASLSSGRIVARIKVDSAYPFMGLAQGVNYYWFDSNAKEGGRCLMIPADTTRPITTMQCSLSNHGRSTSGRSRAHFVRVNPVYASTDCNAGCCVSPRPSGTAAAAVDAAFRAEH